MEEIQYGTIRIGQIVELFVDSIGLDALLENVSNKEIDSKKAMIKRLRNEKEIRIDNLRDFESLIKEFCQSCLNQEFITQTHSYIIQMLYYDLLSMITNTCPYNNPTQKEVELQVMYCIALTLREIYDSFVEKENKSPGEALELTLSLFNFWKKTDYKENTKLIPSCFDFIFSEIENPKTDMYTYWNSQKDLKNLESKTSYAKSINDWMNNKKPTWKLLKPIFSSEIPKKITFKNSESNYILFKWNLFIGYFFRNFFTSLENQKLVSTQFKDTVQNGIRWFYWHFFAKKGDFSRYEMYEVQNPMFSLMRFLVHPSQNNRRHVSEYTYEAFDKEIGLTDTREKDCKSLYYIPLHKITVPLLDTDELMKQLQTFQLILETSDQLSTWEKQGIFKNKMVKEDELDFVMSLPQIGKCGQFYYNWFKGKFFALCHEYKRGLDFYDKAFDNKYFAGKALPIYLEEYLSLIKECNCKLPKYNHVHEWANAVNLYIKDIDKGRPHVLRNSFDEIFPKEAFII